MVEPCWKKSPKSMNHNAIESSAESGQGQVIPALCYDSSDIPLAGISQNHLRLNIGIIGNTGSIQLEMAGR